MLTEQKRMSATLFVGNVSYDTTENELQSLFAQHGTVTSVNLMVDRVTQKPRGFAFVAFETKEAADTAMKALNGYDLHDRKLTVNEARPKEDRPPREGGGGPRRGGPGPRRD
jgi:cold-inducible RNA-binding protein